MKYESVHKSAKLLCFIQKVQDILLISTKLVKLFIYEIKLLQAIINLSLKIKISFLVEQFNDGILIALVKV